jgi:hypothetical protein
MPGAGWNMGSLDDAVRLEAIERRVKYHEWDFKVVGHSSQQMRRPCKYSSSYVNTICLQTYMHNNPKRSSKYHHFPHDQEQGTFLILSDSNTSTQTSEINLI